MTDTLVLTLPNEPRFFAVVRLVLGGFASQCDLPYELMDDLQLAVETVLARAGADGEAFTLRIAPREHGITVLLRPIDETALSERRTDGTAGSGLGLRQILSALVTTAEVVSFAGERWLGIEQHIPSRGAASR